MCSDFGEFSGMRGCFSLFTSFGPRTEVRDVDDGLGTVNYLFN